MQFGRRAFMTFVGAALAGTSIDPSSAVIQTGGHFIDNRLGFGFRIPDGWHLEAFSKFHQLRDTQQLAEPYQDDEEMMEDQLQNLHATLTKYSLASEGEPCFSPGITFFKAENEDEFISSYDTLEELARDAIIGFGMLLSEYECFEEPRLKIGRNFKSVRAKSRFLFEAKGMQSTMVDDEMIAVHYRDRLYTIHLFDSPYTGDTSQQEFSKFKASLHLA